MIDLTGRVVLITGAGGGIGQATARTLARAGATVVLHDGGPRAIQHGHRLRPGRCAQRHPVTGGGREQARHRRVRDDLAAGRLKRLDLSEWTGGFYAFHAIYRTDTPPGPAAAWLIRHFARQAAAETAQAAA